MADEPKVLSIVPTEKKEALLDKVRVIYNDLTEEILDTDSWGESTELQGFIVFFRTINKNDSEIIGFRRADAIRGIDFVK